MFRHLISVKNGSYLGETIEKVYRSGRYNKRSFGWISYKGKKFKLLGTADDLYIVIPFK